MNAPKLRVLEDGTREIERFSPFRRVEHWFAFATFALLILTGFPQKFYDAGWASALTELFGGLDTMRTFHRVAGIAFSIHALLHVGAAVVGLLTHKMRWTLLPLPQDLRDAWQNLRYYLGMAPNPPRLPKFDYRQKFEYVGLIMGGVVMIVTGFFLMYPIIVAQLLPGQFIPAARMMHSSEAVLAFLTIAVWHIYGASLAPEVFPFDKVILSGYMPVEELRHKHRREYDRLFPEGEQSAAPAGEEGKAEPPEKGAKAG
ncbi:MAG: cytochrome b/b6 domain-containing protein [Deltaproteobacteria bacterium]|nr:cytochrome b/b6 domain-containing protein [Deltaproteobacteria bacterium]